MEKKMKLSAAMILVASLALTGCFNKSDTPASEGQDKPSSQASEAPVSAKDAPVTATPASLPRPDLGTPEASYVKVDSGNQLMFLYAANSNLPANYEKLASSFSAEYRNTSDNFKKHDLLEALKPQLEAKIQEARTHPYVLWGVRSPELDHYDFERKGFPVGAAMLDDTVTGYMRDNSEYRLTFTNGSQFKLISVPDETMARQIEAGMSQYPGYNMKIFGFVQSTDGSQDPTVKAQITKIQLLDGNGKVLVEQKA